MSDLLFTALDITNKPALIIGGGKVADRKAKKLIKCGAAITIISPEITDDLRTLEHNKALSVKLRPYQPGDITGAFLVVIATNDNAVNIKALKEAEQLDILINAAFNKLHGNSFFPTTRRFNNFTLSIMTDEKSPKKSNDIISYIVNNLNAQR